MHICSLRSTLTTLLITALFSALAGGCALSSSKAVKFSSSEVEKIPPAAMTRLLLSGSENVSLVVKASSQSEPLTVWKPDTEGYVIVTNAKAEASRMALSEIREIYRVYHPKKTIRKSSGTSTTAEEVGVALIYAPLIPVGVASWPVLSAMGLDEQKNSEDREKARLVYDGLTRPELEGIQGAPVEKYLCQRTDRKDSPVEIWAYEKEKVIRAARYLFIDTKTGKVYFSSFRMPGWMECAPHNIE